MADAQRTIDLIFNGIDKTGAATLSALDNAKSVTGSVKNLTQPISDFTVGALKLEAGLLAAGTAMTVFAVKAAGDFDTSFREIATLLDKPIEDLGDFREAILKYASSSTAPLEQVTLAIYNAISAGVPLEESIAAVSRAEKLSVAGKADLNETLRVLVSSLNAYGLGMDNADRFSDALFLTVKNGQTTLPELAASLAQVTGAAAAVGVPFETMLAAISTLTAAGTPTAQAVTQINAVLTSLLKPSKEASDLAAELGIEFSAQAVKAKGLEVVLQEVATATGGNQTQMAKLFGSTEALKAVFPLTGASATKFAADLDAMTQKTGATDEAFTKMAASIKLGSQAVANAFTVMLVAIGTPLLDELGGVSKAIVGIFTALGASVKEGELKDLVTYVEGLFGDLQQTLATVAKNLPAALANADLSGFKNGIESVVGAFAKLFSNIDITTVDGLTRAIELAGAAFLGLSKFTAGVIESFKPLFDKLVEIGAQIGGLGPDFFTMAGNISGVVTQFNLLLGGITGLLPYLEALVGLMVARQGLSLLGGVSALVTTLPAMTAALSAAGVVMAAYFASDKVVALVSALVEWKKANDHLAESQQQSLNITDRAGLSLQRFAETTGIVAKSVDEAMKLVDNGTVVWSTATNGWVKAGDALVDVGKAAQSTDSAFDKSNAAMIDAFVASEKAAGGINGLATAQKESNTYALKTVPIIDKLTGAITGYEQQLVKTEGGTIKLSSATDKAGANLTKIAQETQKAEAAQKKWNEEVAKMAFQEKLALIEQQSKLMTAQIEADAKKTVAAFESIGNTITSTGDVLGELFGQFKEFDNLSWSAQSIVKDQIDKENDLRQKAFDLQKNLTEAQIGLMKAQTDALVKGDGLIKIDGAGLKPHLEAFMWEILQAIQIKVNKDGLKMLLGA